MQKISPYILQHLYSSVKARLLSTINRVYECKLAELELEVLGAENIEFDLDRLEFNFEAEESRAGVLKKRLSWFESLDSEATWICDVVRSNKKVLRGHADLWYSHFSYSYKARFRPPLARSLINIVNPEEEGIVLDNFCGSGTTQVEASLLGLDSVGVDINPFYTFMTEAKMKFFTQGLENVDAQRIWNSILKHPLGYFHPLTYVIYSFATQMHFENPERAFLRKYHEIRALQEEWWKIKERYRLGKVETKTCSAESLPYPDEHFTGVVASPPYSSAIDYTRENRGAPEFFPVTPELRKLYKPTKNLGLYKGMMRKAIKETVRVVKPGRKIAFVVGNQRKDGKIVGIIDWCIKRFEENGCCLLQRIPQLISSTGTWNILVDEILIFRKN